MKTPTRNAAVPRADRWPAIASAALLILTLAVGGATAHGPDPILAGGPFGQNEDLRFKWRTGAEPAPALKPAIKAAAADANATRGSKAATFTYDATGANPIGYGLGASCGVNGIACFTRAAPNGFTMWFREQGHIFDWGTLKWCQSYQVPPNGCYDAENVALDEFGHVEILGHHDNHANDSDYADAVVQTYSRTKPQDGWNAHAFGRCDVATLQLQYDMQTWVAKYSTCLDLSTVLTLSASPANIPYRGTTTLTATLKVVDLTSYVRLGGNPVSGRVVTLQRRSIGATTWVTVATMLNGSSSGSYVLAQRLQADADYRAVFKTPTGEGINGSTSPTVRVDVGACSVQCPLSLPMDEPSIDSPAR